MALSPELTTFCHNWRTKAEAYCSEEIGGAFDRFFTLYVAFNRLYAEATFRLARRGQVKLGKRFPDSYGAQEYLLQFCGAEALTRAWEGDPNTFAALHQIADHLREGRFALKLDMMTGDRRPDADRELLSALESRSRNRRGHAVLEALYAIRCNLFHGHKGFEPIQLELLRPAVLLLESTINVLYRALDEDGG
jgi:hypothetical protein